MRKIKICMTIFVMTLIALLGVACNKTSSTIMISGVKNIECSYTVTEYDLLAGVTASNGAEVKLSGNVNFGTPGEYKISYTCGNTTMNATVKIYGEPTVITATDVTVSYDKAFSGDVTNGIAVKDTFGATLSAEFIGFEEDVEYPRYDTTYTAKYAAADKVGNSVEFTRKITAQQGNVSFDNVIVDLADDTYAFDLKNATFAGLYDENGNVYHNVYENNGKLYNLNSVGAKLGVGTHTVTMVCSIGYDDISMTVTDDKPFVYLFDYADETKGIENYIWAVGEEVTFPEVINKKGTYQQFEAEYELYYQGDKLDGATAFSETGEYTYAIQVTRKGETTTIENKFYIVSEKEKLNYSYSTLSNQFVNAWMPFEDSGNRISYVGAIEDNNATAYNAIEFYDTQIQTTGATRMLRFNNSIMKQIFQSGSTTITMDVLLKESFAENVYIFAMLEGNGGWDCSPNEQYSVNADEWKTVTFDFSSCWLHPIAFTPELYTVDYYGNYTINWNNFGLVISPFISGRYNQNDTREAMSVYIANVRFGETSVVEEKTYYAFDGEAGDKVTLNASGLTAVVDGTQESSVNVYVTENGVVKSVAENADTPLAYPTIGEINGDVLTYKGREYVAVSYDSGAIMNVGKAEMPEYGIVLAKYGCETKYRLIQLSIGMTIKEMTPMDMSVTFTKTGGYNLQLIVTFGNSEITFDNYMYVKDENSFLNELTYEKVELKYAGKMQVNGVIKDVFKVERIGGDAESHRIIQFNADYVNKK